MPECGVRPILHPRFPYKFPKCGKKPLQILRGIVVMSGTGQNYGVHPGISLKRSAGSGGNQFIKPGEKNSARCFKVGQILFGAVNLPKQLRNTGKPAQIVQRVGIRCKPIAPFGSQLPWVIRSSPVKADLHGADEDFRP